MGFQYSHDVADVAASDVSAVSCSICLETVLDNGVRSCAKLLCGHQFHLDCIGSAFNFKGEMQCPNCRKIEKGQWLYANGGCGFPDLNVDDWAHEEDPYDFRYSEMSLGVHWCPFNGLTRLPTSFNEGQFPSNGYHDIVGQHAISTEHASVTSGSHPCPYVAFISPLNPSSSNMGTHVSDGTNFSGHWTLNESLNTYAPPSMDVHYHSWDHPSPHITATSNQSSSVEHTSIPSVNQRYSRPSADIQSFMQPLHGGHSSGARAGSMASSSMSSSYPGSNARARDRVQALQAYYQRPNAAPSSRTPGISGSSRWASHRGGMTQFGSVHPPSHQHQQQLSGFQHLPSSPSSSIRNYMESETHMPRGYHVWERDPSSSSDSGGVIFNGYRQRRASERASSHNGS